ncbi:unnamed protein product [Miscanthus lutarioriparius]|uniref:AP-5 complex subunit zeta-1 ARM repeats domain-containing protein n=1 Tax=Miscanthus lutarioriparius TaxID=422564 RepID=A0A811RXG1_9POAL|nr:unnamed protein product [Miscanthus lutarioriparius]
MEPKKPASPTPSLANLRPCGANPEMPLRVDGSVVQARDATATEAQAQQRRFPTATYISTFHDYITLPFILTILQSFLDFGEAVLHDADGSLKTFFRSCLSREFADPIVAERTVEFLVTNKTKILSSFPNLIPQFYPLLLKLIASNGERLENKFAEVLPLMMPAGSFLPLFLSLMNLPMLVVALEKVERSSGTLIGSSIATIQKSAAPEMLLALMDEAYTGSAIEEPSGNSGSDDSGPLDLADPMFLDLLKDENDGIAVSKTLDIPYGTYLAVMTVIFFWAMRSTDFFTNTFAVRSLHGSREEMMSALYLQVLMRVEQEQKVTEDAHICAEQDAATQKYAAHILQARRLKVGDKPLLTVSIFMQDWSRS